MMSPSNQNDPVTNKSDKESKDSDIVVHWTPGSAQRSPGRLKTKATISTLQPMNAHVDFLQRGIVKAYPARLDGR